MSYSWCNIRDLMKVCKHAQIWSKLRPLRSKFGSIQFWIVSPQLAQLIFVNELPFLVGSNVKMFADNCKLYQTISDTTDGQLLQQDLVELERWMDQWLLKLNPTKSLGQTAGSNLNLDRYIIKMGRAMPWTNFPSTWRRKWTELKKLFFLTILNWLRHPEAEGQGSGSGNALIIFTFRLFFTLVCKAFIRAGTVC